MTSTEELLRQAMHEHTSGLQLAPAAGAKAVAGAQRRARRLVVLRTAAVATVVVLIGLVAATVRPWESGSAVPAGTPRVTFTAPSPLPSVPPSALDGVSLPNPAPGFPVRIGASTRKPLLTKDFGTTFWSRSFVLGARSDYADASIVVGDITVDGLGPHARIQGDRVKLTTLVQGHPAYLVHRTKDGNQNILYFSSGRFTVMITGQSGTSVDQLVALGNALTGLE